MPSINDISRQRRHPAGGAPAVGQPVPVVIRGSRRKTSTTSCKLEVAFCNKQRVLLCNKTNAASIAEFTGTRTTRNGPVQKRLADQVANRLPWAVGRVHPHRAEPTGTSRDSAGRRPPPSMFPRPTRVVSERRSPRCRWGSRTPRSEHAVKQVTRSRS